eukprot:3215117-Rhodomonas_salina.2
MESAAIYGGSAAIFSDQSAVSSEKSAVYSRHHLPRCDFSALDLVAAYTSINRGCFRVTSRDFEVSSGGFGAISRDFGEVSGGFGCDFGPSAHRNIEMNLLEGPDPLRPGIEKPN